LPGRRTGGFADIGRPRSGDDGVGGGRWSVGVGIKDGGDTRGGCEDGGNITVFVALCLLQKKTLKLFNK
jgi:hypothetical protein